MPVLGPGMELRRAVLEGDVEATQRLLSRKADPNTTVSFRDSSETLLEIAVRQDSEPICRLLLVCQAEPSVQCERPSSSTSLVNMWARGDPSDVPVVLASLEALVRAAVDSHDVTLLGLSLATLEVAGGDTQQCTSQLDREGRSLLHRCAARSAVDERGEAAARLTARTLLGFGCSANGSALDTQEAPLLIAVRARAGRLPDSSSGFMEPARALLEARGDVEGVDEAGMMPIMLAVMQGDVEACQLLMDFGADPWRLSPITGQSAMDLAAAQPKMLAALRPRLASHGAGEGREEIEKRAKRTRSGSLLFAMDIDHHGALEGLASADGLLNQVDLEESYESEWSPSHSLPVASSEWSCSTQAANTEGDFREAMNSPPKRDAKSLLSHLVAC